MTLKIYNAKITRSVLRNNHTYYPKVFLEEFLNKKPKTKKKEKNINKKIKENFKNVQEIVMTRMIQAKTYHEKICTRICKNIIRICPKSVKKMKKSKRNHG